eukprot:261999-Prymnesium_polylepis.2
MGYGVLVRVDAGSSRGPGDVPGAWWLCLWGWSMHAAGGLPVTRRQPSAPREAQPAFSILILGPHPSRSGLARLGLVSRALGGCRARRAHAPPVRRPGPPAPAPCSPCTRVIDT